MPIRINLLNEVLAEEDLRRRDPVKRAIFVGIFLLVLTLAWYSSTWLEYKLTQQSLSRATDEIQLLTNDFNRVQTDLKKISEGQRQLDALQQLSTNRFLQGNLMNALQQVYVSGVQLQQVKIEQAYALVAGTADKTNEWGVVQRGRPSTSTQAITLSLQAKDSSSNPGDQVNPYKDALAKLDYFKSNLNPTNGIKLATLSAPQVSGGGRPYVMFTLECRFTTR